MSEMKIRKFGNSLGVILPKDVLSRLKMSEGDKIFLIETSEGYSLTPYDPEFDKTMEVARKIMKKRRNALRELAK